MATIVVATCVVPLLADDTKPIIVKATPHEGSETSGLRGRRTQLVFYELCNICSGNKFPPDESLLDSVLNIPSLGFALTCGSAYLGGQSGFFSPEFCTGLQEVTETGVCGCQTAAPTVAPSLAPSLPPFIFDDLDGDEIPDVLDLCPGMDDLEDPNCQDIIGSTLSCNNKFNLAINKSVPGSLIGEFEIKKSADGSWRTFLRFNIEAPVLLLVDGSRVSDSTVATIDLIVQYGDDELTVASIPSSETRQGSIANDVIDPDYEFCITEIMPIVNRLLCGRFLSIAACIAIWPSLPAKVGCAVIVAVLVEIAGSCDDSKYLFEEEICKGYAPVRDWWSYIWGDPHIITFDGLEFDCQGAGIFRLLETSTMEVQGLFVRTGDNLPSVTRGIVARNGDLPTLQVTILDSPHNMSSSINGCEVLLSVDRNPTDFNSAVLNGQCARTFVSVSQSQIYLNLLELDIRVRVFQHPTFGCYINVATSLFGTFEDASGLLGTPNRVVADDWTTAEGELVPVPTTFVDRRFETAYNYCTSNWCISNESQSLFSFEGVNASFAFYSRCDEEFGAAADLESVPDEISELCGGNEGCIIDGIVGGVEGAIQAGVAISDIELQNSTGIVGAQLKTFVILGTAQSVVGSQDPCILASIDGGASYFPAYVVPYSFYSGTTWPLLRDTVNYLHGYQSSFEGAFGVEEFRVRWVMPDQFVDAAMTLDLVADNEAFDIKLNEKSLPGFFTRFTYEGLGNDLVTGLNELSFKLRDSGGLVGTNFRIDISYVGNMDSELVCY